MDTENVYERPIQVFFNNVKEIEPWAKGTLAKAGEHAYVVIYRVTEVEVGTIKKSDYDKGAVSGIPAAGEEAGKPSA